MYFKNGNIIKYEREKNKLKKTELGKLVGVTSAYIEQLENGKKTNPSIDVLNKIAKSLNISVKDLVNNETDVKNELSLGSKIKEYRVKNNLNQKELANKLDISAVNLSRYENGERSISIDMLIKIANVLKIKLSDLIDGDTNIYKTKSDEIYIQNNYSWELLKDTIELNNVVNMLNYPELDLNIIYKYLRESKILDKNNKPYQEYIDKGCFVDLEQKFTDKNGITHINIKTLVYPKGIELIKETLKYWEVEIKVLYEMNNRKEK